MTLPEVKLWVLLRARPDGLRFRRQHPIGPYVLDFYCPQARLAIEVDGAVHGMADNARRDAVRDRWLAEQRIATLRIPAADVLGDVGAIVRHIVMRCLPLHHPADGPPPHALHGEDGVASGGPAS